MALKVDALNATYDSLKNVSQDAADKFIDSLSEEDYNALAERRDNQRSIPDQIKRGALKGVVPSYMEPQLDAPSPTTLEQGIETGIEGAKAGAEMLGTIAGGVYGAAANTINPVAGLAETAALGGRLGGAAGGLAGQAPVGAILGTGLGAAAGMTPAGRAIGGASLGQGLGAELTQKYLNKGGVEIGRAAGLDTTGAEDAQQKEGVPSFVTAALFGAMGQGGKKVLATGAVKEIGRKVGAIGETVANKGYTKLGDTSISKPAIELATNTQAAGKKIMDAAKSKYDVINAGFNRAKEAPPQTKINFLKRGEPIKNSQSVYDEFLSLPEGDKVGKQILKVTGADEAMFQKVKGVNRDYPGYDKAYKKYRDSALQNVTSKELEASKRYFGDALKMNNPNSGTAAVYANAEKVLNAKSLQTDFKPAIENYRKAKDMTSIKGKSLGDPKFNEMMDPSVPLEDKADQLTDYLFKDIPTGSTAKLAALNKGDKNFSRNFLKNTIIKAVKDSPIETSPFGMVKGKISPELSKTAKEFGKMYGAGNAEVRTAGDIPFLSDPSQLKKMLELAKVDVAEVSSNPDVVNYNAQILNRTFRNPKTIEKLKSAGVPQARINKVLKMTEEAANSQVLYKGMEKFFQNPNLTTHVGKQIGKQLPFNMSAEQALKAAPVVEKGMAPIANFLKNAIMSSM